jgi:hypothetical protein
MDAAEVKATSLKMCNLLPDDPKLAVTVAGLNFAHVVVATGCNDETALEVVRRALKQMRRGTWWMDS